jgi:hypothetical protein
VLEFPGGYTRSVGPVIGRFLTELRDGVIVGARAKDGTVVVPPVEYDHDGEPVTGEFVPVGPAGTVETWSWVTEPRPGHPLDHPFAWALIKLDGADTALLHAIDFGPGKTKPPSRLAKGLRVRPSWRAERTGEITDIAAFRPEVAMITSPVSTRYRLSAGEALTRFLNGVAEGRLIGHRCGSCQKVFVPMKGLCPTCGVPTTEEVEVSDEGTVTTFAVNNIPDPRAPAVPFVSAYVLLDGSDVAMLALVADVPAEEVRIGMRVRAVWRPREEWRPSMENIKWFAPTGDPDAGVAR